MDKLLISLNHIPQLVNLLQEISDYVLGFNQGRSTSLKNLKKFAILWVLTLYVISIFKHAVLKIVKTKYEEDIYYNKIMCTLKQEVSE